MLQIFKKHKNIINLKEFFKNHKIYDIKGEESTASFGVMDWLYDVYAFVWTEPFSPEICRKFFKELISALDFMHKN